MKEYFETPKEPLFVAGEEVEFKMAEYDFENKGVRDIWVKGKIKQCLYFKNCANVEYFRPQDGQVELKEMEFMSLRKLNPIVKPPLGLMPEYIWIEKRMEEIDAAIKRYSAADKFIPMEWVAEYSTLKHKLENRSILFKSVDGVDILHGTKFFSVTDEYNIVFSDAVNGHEVSDFIIKRSFSSIEAAKNWIAWNKPHLSVSEIMSNSSWHCGANDMERRCFSRKELIDLSMSKVGRHEA